MSTRKNRLIRKIRKHYGPLILIGLMMVSAGMSGFFFGHAYGEQYIPNLTKSEWEEYRLMELCYIMENDITIELLDEFCMTSYGSLESMYGDKITK